LHPLGSAEKAAILLAVGVAVILGMILGALLLGHQPGNAANNIVMTGGE